MRIAVIGVGLIGGSLAICLKQRKLVSHVIGIDNNETHLQQALDKGLVDSTTTQIKDGIKGVDMVILAVPVDISVQMVAGILSQLEDGQILVEVGSTKNAICEEVKNHPRRQQFVATHPMWGTEHSGPLSARSDAFVGRVCILCEAERSSPSAVATVQKMYESLEMNMVDMPDSLKHDMHLAYVSHISHVSSFALANTVLEKEKQEDKILALASSGFETTVRLAKSNVHTWVPILLQNKKFVIDVLDEYIHQMNTFKKSLEDDDRSALTEQIKKSNQIKKILK